MADLGKETWRVEGPLEVDAVDRVAIRVLHSAPLELSRYGCAGMLRSVWPSGHASKRGGISLCVWKVERKYVTLKRVDRSTPARYSYVDV